MSFDRFLAVSTQLLFDTTEVSDLSETQLAGFRKKFEEEGKPAPFSDARAGDINYTNFHSDGNLFVNLTPLV